MAFDPHLANLMALQRQAHYDAMRAQQGGGLFGGLQQAAMAAPVPPPWGEPRGSKGFRESLQAETDTWLKRAID